MVLHMLQLLIFWNDDFVNRPLVSISPREDRLPPSEPRVGCLGCGRNRDVNKPGTHNFRWWHHEAEIQIKSHKIRMNSCEYWSMNKTNVFDGVVNDTPRRMRLLFQSITELKKQVLKCWWLNFAVFAFFRHVDEAVKWKRCKIACQVDMACTFEFVLHFERYDSATRWQCYRTRSLLLTRGRGVPVAPPFPPPSSPAREPRDDLKHQTDCWSAGLQILRKSVSQFISQSVTDHRFYYVNIGQGCWMRLAEI